MEKDARIDQFCKSALAAIQIWWEKEGRELYEKGELDDGCGDGCGDVCG